MTLTEASFWTKRFGVIALGAMGIFTVVVLLLTLQSEDNMPPEYLTANFACTETRDEFLKHQLEIPSLNLAEGSEMVFKIETETGKIDSLPNIINVYEFNNPTQSLRAQANAKEIAGAMGFDKEGIIRRSTQSYVWIDDSTSRTLEIQAKNLNLSLRTDPNYIREISRESSIPSESEATSIAASTLKGLNLYSEDYSNGVPKTTLINIEPDGSFTKASSLSEAELVRVDFTRNKSMITISSNIVGADNMVRSLSQRMTEEPLVETRIVNDEKITVYTFNTLVAFPETQKSNITVYVGVKNQDAENDAIENIYQIDYTYWPVNVDPCGTYELISPQQAIEAVQNGEGSLVYLYDKEGDDVAEYTSKVVKTFSVFSVNIVYYESREELEYLQPVYVISGEAVYADDSRGEFDFFYPAINYGIVQDKVVLPEPEVVEESGLL